MNLKEYLNFDYLFVSMCLAISLKYFTSKDPKFVIQYS
jgi:hypothetical protein